MNHNMQAKQLKLQNQKNVVYHKFGLQLFSAHCCAHHIHFKHEAGSGQVLANGGVRPLWWEHNILDHSQTWYGAIIQLIEHATWKRATSLETDFQNSREECKAFLIARMTRTNSEAKRFPLRLLSCADSDTAVEYPLTFQAQILRSKQRGQNDASHCLENFCSYEAWVLVSLEVAARCLRQCGRWPLIEMAFML